MSRVILITGPVGAGKTTVARKLVPLLSGPVACLEGDVFWTFISKTDRHNPRENFNVIMRAMTAAAIPFARSGYDVVIDFSMPPHFLEVARKILKELPIEHVILKPAQVICAARAAARPEGAIQDYSRFAGLYSLFAGADRHAIDNSDMDPDVAAARILAGLEAGTFRVL